MTDFPSDRPLTTVEIEAARQRGHDHLAAADAQILADNTPTSWRVGYAAGDCVSSLWAGDQDDAVELAVSLALSRRITGVWYRPLYRGGRIGEPITIKGGVQ